ncbi:MAG: TlpA family protein disulfide reductase [Gammaproteobacteria bacterium]|nr:TlpA family protein disulfide reductase [Gammaproteobacteria bacterium]
MRSLIQRLAGIVTIASLFILTGCSGNRAPAIEVQHLLDASQTLNLAQPQKPTLVVFWATNCSSCIEEIPSIIALQKMYGDKIHIVGIAMSFDDPTTLKNFVLQRQLPYMIAHDSNGDIALGFGKIFVTPTNLLLSPDGKIVWKNVGDLDKSTLQKRIDEMLKTPA